MFKIISNRALFFCIRNTNPHIFTLKHKYFRGLENPEYFYHSSFYTKTKILFFSYSTLRSSDSFSAKLSFFFTFNCSFFGTPVLRFGMNILTYVLRLKYSRKGHKFETASYPTIPIYFSLHFKSLAVSCLLKNKMRVSLINVTACKYLGRIKILMYGRRMLIKIYF